MILKQLKISILALIVLSALTGLVYPLLITAVAQFALPRRADGSLILRDGKPIGSELIGQPFEDPKYFWGRLSATATPYDASNSSGSNLGPLNPALTKAAQNRIDALLKTDPGNKELVPVDLVTASASGLDPDISPAAAYYQVRRVAKYRKGVSEQKLRELIAENTEHRFLGILGEPAVNVLKLNLALDAPKKK